MTSSHLHHQIFVRRLEWLQSKRLEICQAMCVSLSLQRHASLIPACINSCPWSLQHFE